MVHWKKLLDPGVFLGPQDFDAEKTVKVSRVIREKIESRGGEKGDGDGKDAGVMMYFAHNGAELPRKLKLAKSVMYGMSLTYGTDTDGWVGKDVTLFRAKCLSFGEVEECVRIRFSAEVDSKIRRWLKKRKKDPAMYMLAEQGGA